jgi:hypothetical protein
MSALEPPPARPAAPDSQPQGEAAVDAVLRALPVRVARWTSAVVGFVATLLGVVFVLFPAIKPEGPPATKRASLSNPAVASLSWAQYLDRMDLDRAPYDASALRRRGVFVEFDYSIDGYRNKALPLRWQLIDARRGEQLRHSRDTLIVPEARTDAGTWSVWVPLPRRRVTRAYVELQLYEDSGQVPIGRVRTAPFAASAVRD